MQIQQQNIVSFVKADVQSAQKEIWIAALYVKQIQFLILTTINKYTCHGAFQIASLDNMKYWVISAVDLAMPPALFAILLLSIAKNVKMYQEYLIFIFLTNVC